MGFIADIFTGGDQAQRQQNTAASQIQFNPFAIQGQGLGQISSSQPGQIDLGQSQLADQFGGLFTNQARGLFGQAQGSPFGSLSPFLQQGTSAMNPILTESKYGIHC